MILSTVTIVHIGTNIDNTVLAVGDSESSPHITLVSNVSLVSRTEGISCTCTMQAFIQKKLTGGQNPNSEKWGGKLDIHVPQSRGVIFVFRLSDNCISGAF